MNEQSIQKQYNQIVSLLEYKRLKEALVQLDAFLYNSNDWTLRNRLEQIQTSYQYMLQYMKLGMKDPERQIVSSTISRYLGNCRSDAHPIAG